MAQIFPSTPPSPLFTIEHIRDLPREPFITTEKVNRVLAPLGIGLIPEKVEQLQQLFLAMDQIMTPARLGQGLAELPKASWQDITTAAGRLFDPAEDPLLGGTLSADPGEAPLTGAITPPSAPSRAWEQLLGAMPLLWPLLIGKGSAPPWVRDLLRRILQTKRAQTPEMQERFVEELRQAILETNQWRSPESLHPPISPSLLGRVEQGVETTPWISGRGPVTEALEHSLPTTIGLGDPITIDINPPPLSPAELQAMELAEAAGRSRRQARAEERAISREIELPEERTRPRLVPTEQSPRRVTPEMPPAVPSLTVGTRLEFTDTGERLEVLRRDLDRGIAELRVIANPQWPRREGEPFTAFEASLAREIGQGSLRVLTTPGTAPIGGSVRAAPAPIPVSTFGRGRVVERTQTGEQFAIREMDQHTGHVVLRMIRATNPRDQGLVGTDTTVPLSSLQREVESGRYRLVSREGGEGTRGAARMAPLAPGTRVAYGSEQGEESIYEVVSHDPQIGRLHLHSPNDPDPFLRQGFIYTYPPGNPPELRVVSPPAGTTPGTPSAPPAGPPGAAPSPGTRSGIAAAAYDEFPIPHSIAQIPPVGSRLYTTQGIFVEVMGPHSFERNTLPLRVIQDPSGRATPGTMFELSPTYLHTPEEFQRWQTETPAARRIQLPHPLEETPGTAPGAAPPRATMISQALLPFEGRTIYRLETQEMRDLVRAYADTLPDGLRADQQASLRMIFNRLGDLHPELRFDVSMLSEAHAMREQGATILDTIAELQRRYAPRESRGGSAGTPTVPPAGTPGSTPGASLLGQTTPDQLRARLQQELQQGPLRDVSHVLLGPTMRLALRLRQEEPHVALTDRVVQRLLMLTAEGNTPEQALPLLLNELRGPLQAP